MPEENLIKCLVCYKPFQVIKKGYVSGNKISRAFKSSGNFTCSKDCSRIYCALRNHFRFKLKKEAKTEQVQRISKIIEEEGEKFAETEVTEYSEGYSNGWIACINLILTKIKGSD